MVGSHQKSIEYFRRTSILRDTACLLYVYYMQIVAKNPKFVVLNALSIKAQRCIVKLHIFSTLTLEEAECIEGCLIIHTNWVLVIQMVPPADCVTQSVTPIDSSSYAHQDTTDFFIIHKMSVDPLSYEQDITEGSFMYKISLTNRTLHTKIPSSFIQLDTTDCLFMHSVPLTVHHLHVKI